MHTLPENTTAFCVITFKWKRINKKKKKERRRRSSRRRRKRKRKKLEEEEKKGEKDDDHHDSRAPWWMSTLKKDHPHDSKTTPVSRQYIPKPLFSHSKSRFFSLKYSHVNIYPDQPAFSFMTSLAWLQLRWTEKRGSTVLTNTVDTWEGNSLAMMAKLAVMNAEAPKASTARTKKHITMNMVPGGHLPRVLSAETFTDLARGQHFGCHSCTWKGIFQ